MASKDQKTKTGVLLETTIQLHRIVDATDIRARIHAELRGRQLFSTSYVLREFLRTVITDLAYVYNAVQEVGGDADGRIALSKVLWLLAHGKGNYSPRAARREHYVIAAILKCFETTTLYFEELRSFLEMTAQQWIKDFFEIQIDGASFFRIPPENYFTALDDAPGDMDMERWTSTPQPPDAPLFPARAGMFLQDRVPQVAAVEGAMRAAPSRRKDSKLLTMLDRMKDTKTGKYDFIQKLTPRTRGNWAMGDLLIALETPLYLQIYTTDRHYETICVALGLTRFPGFLPGRLQHPPPE